MPPVISTVFMLFLQQPLHVFHYIILDYIMQPAELLWRKFVLVDQYPWVLGQLLSMLPVYPRRPLKQFTELRHQPPFPCIDLLAEKGGEDIYKAVYPVKECLWHLEFRATIHYESLLS